MLSIPSPPNTVTLKTPSLNVAVNNTGPDVVGKVWGVSVFTSYSPILFLSCTGAGLTSLTGTSLYGRTSLFVM